MNIKLYTKYKWNNMKLALALNALIFIFGIIFLFTSQTINNYIFAIVFIVLATLSQASLINSIIKGKEDLLIIKNIDRYEIA